MKSYTVTLAAFATVLGSTTVEAENVNDAIAEAVRTADQADWPVTEAGAIEVDPGYAYAHSVHAEGLDRFPKFGHGLSPEIAAKIALAKLQEARDLLKIAGAPRAMERVRLAITSAGGAVRHAEGKAYRRTYEKAEG